MAWIRPCIPWCSMALMLLPSKWAASEEDKVGHVVRDGKSQAVVVIGDRATWLEQHAAKEVARYLQAFRERYGYDPLAGRMR